MPNYGRAAALLDAARGGRLRAEALSTLPTPPWDYDALQAYRSPHAATGLQTARAGDAQQSGPVVVVVGTATFAHPVIMTDPASIGGLMIVSENAGHVLLYQCVALTPPVVTTPEAPTVSVPVTLWDSYPGG